MSRRLEWLPMNDIVCGHADKVVLRRTKGDSEWIDCSNSKFILIAKKEPWLNLTDFTDALFKIDGVIPNEATWLGENNEPGRVVFCLSESDTNLNPKRSAYYCRIIETDLDGSNPRSAFMGKFRVVLAGDNYKPIKEDA